MTDTELVRGLVADLRPARPSNGAGALATGFAAGAGVAAWALAAHFGVQSGLDGPAMGPFLTKAAYTLPLAGLAFLGLVTLARPGGATPRGVALLAPVAGLAMAAAAALGSAEPADAAALLWGAGWARCPARIAALSAPVFVGVILALRRRAPTRLRTTGAAAGLLSGATGATLYALACAEPSPVFVLAWYSAGMAACTAVGTLTGPRLLRW